MKAKYIEDYAASGVEPFRVEGCEFGQLYFSTFFDKDDALIFERHDIDGTTMFELKNAKTSAHGVHYTVLDVAPKQLQALFDYCKSRGYVE
jgi:hypothetical protein